MKKTHRTQMIAAKPAYQKLLKEYGLSTKSHNRFDHAFSVLERAEKLKKEGEAFDPQFTGDYRFALLDIDELIDIIPALEGEDPVIVKDKLTQMLQGTHSRTEETAENSLARNTQFELYLMARMKQAGLPAKLHAEHPDISVATEKRLYGVEAKRIFSDKPEKVKSNVRTAATQLATYSLPSPTSRGIIALSIDHHLIGSELILAADNEAAVHEILGNQVEAFILHHMPTFQSKEAMKDERISGILVVIRVAGDVAEEGIPITSTWIGGTYGLVTGAGRTYAAEVNKDILVPLKNSV